VEAGIPPGRYIEQMSNSINLKLAHTPDVEKILVNTPGTDIN
jgi:hypothetical protein